MKKLLVVVIFLIFVISCQKKLGNVKNKSVKIIYKGGISVRDISGSKSKPIGIAYENYVYKVVDVKPAYYKIKFVDGRNGWISANIDNKWTKLVSQNEIKVLLKGGITVREEPFNKKSPILGVAAYLYTFKIIQTEYSYIKIKLPEDKTGWIYIGPYTNRWVEFK